MLTEVIEVLSGGNLIAVHLLAALTSLILGMGLPATADYIVMASLTAPFETPRNAGFLRDAVLVQH